MAAKVARIRDATAVVSEMAFERARRRSRWVDEGVARICWIFLEPARWVRMEGHLIAADRSRWSRADQAMSSGYSAGL